MSSRPAEAGCLEPGCTPGAPVVGRCVAALVPLKAPHSRWECNRVLPSPTRFVVSLGRPQARIPPRGHRARARPVVNLGRSIWSVDIRIRSSVSVRPRAVRWDEGGSWCAHYHLPRKRLALGLAVRRESVRAIDVASWRIRKGRCRLEHRRARPDPHLRHRGDVVEGSSFSTTPKSHSLVPVHGSDVSRTEAQCICEAIGVSEGTST